LASPSAKPPRSSGETVSIGSPVLVEMSDIHSFCCFSVDGTLDEKEYLAVVKKKFEAANPDNDGTIDLKELESPKSQELLKLIYK
jgi:hypothetical protein